MTIRSEKITYSRVFKIKPGDGFKYEFIVAYSKGQGADTIYIASVAGNAGVRFLGYSYHVDSIMQFNRKFPGFTEVSENDFEYFLARYKVPESKYIWYMAEKSKCGREVAAVAILVAIKFIQSINDPGGDENDSNS